VEWLSAVVDVGFTIERIADPDANEETARRVPRIADTRIVAYYFHVRCRKARRRFRMVQPTRIHT
jgi:hypothetical protein